MFKVNEDKCIGCGEILQTNDQNALGFVNNINSNLCERCFRIKNYNDYKIVSKTNKDFEPIFNKINQTNDLVIIITDVFHLNIDNIINLINNKILLVITKRDIMPKSMNEERITNYINNKKIVDKVLVSSYKNYNLDELYSKINLYKTSNNVYIVGYTNAGKSTLINKLLYNYSDNKQELTTSLLPSTTLSSIDIKLSDNLTLVDTPGIINENDLSSCTNVELLKKIIPKKPIKPITFQIKSKQFIIIDNILKLELNNVDITLYMSNNLNINRVYKHNSLKEKLKIKKNEDLVLEGIGFITFNKDTEISYEKIENFNIYTRKSL